MAPRPSVMAHRQPMIASVAEMMQRRIQIGRGLAAPIPRFCMYPFHAPTTHLPIGLLLGNALLTVLYLRRGDTTLETGAYHCLWLGWFGVALAVATGIFDAARQLLDVANPRTDALGWINAHALAG